jgi:L-ascorbate metabolism protein UlaG (beta-lactamase superfamily)
MVQIDARNLRICIDPFFSTGVYMLTLRLTFVSVHASIGYEII